MKKINSRIIKAIEKFKVQKQCLQKIIKNKKLNTESNRKIAIIKYSL